MIEHWVTHDLATSIWTLVWHWGTGVGAIILLLAAAFFSPFCKKDFVYAAVIVAVALFIYGYGTVDASRLCDARLKEQVVRLHQSFTFTPKPTTWHW